MGVVCGIGMPILLMGVAAVAPPRGSEDLAWGLAAGALTIGLGAMAWAMSRRRVFVTDAWIEEQPYLRAPRRVAWSEVVGVDFSWAKEIVLRDRNGACVKVNAAFVGFSTFIERMKDTTNDCAPGGIEAARVRSHTREVQGALPQVHLEQLLRLLREHELHRAGLLDL